ncbi:MAG TPA: hypothetical protein VF476_01715 [Chitinophagaceae bacterium]
MKQQLNTGLPGNKKTATPLRNLINLLVSDSLATAIEQKTMIINEVPANLHLTADTSRLGPVISELLATVVSNSRKGRIHITAERFKELIILHVEDRNNYNGYALAYSIKSIEPMATMVGGNITMKGEQKLETMISFSFPNHQGMPHFEC